MSDERLAVRFFQKDEPNEYQSAQQGRPISNMRDFIRIEIPGDSTTIIETFVNDDHKKRFPLQYAHFLNEKSEGIEMEAQGTLLRDWSLLTSAQAKELKHFKFYTVEQVASASDQQIQALGMLVGMHPFSFRDKAKAYLLQAKDSAVVMQQAEEIRKRDQQIADLIKAQERMAREFSELKDKRGPGRPRKEAETV